jgi:hypothetical protein
VSHQSGFRHGGHDFTHRQPPRSQRKGRGPKGLDQRMDQRFRKQERKAQPESAEQDEPTED